MNGLRLHKPFSNDSMFIAWLILILIKLKKKVDTLVCIDLIRFK